jgi:hypothetical protein
MAQKPRRRAASLRQRHPHGPGKLFSIHLVLASLLAAPYPRGRILILDELADSLGR